MELHATLRQLSNRNLEWAKAKLFDRCIYASAGKMWCSECGKEWAGEPMVHDVERICPKCGARMVLKKLRRTKDAARYYFTVLDAVEEWQVVRHYLISRNAWKGARAQYQFFEAVQIWVDSDGHEVIASRQRMGLMGYSDAWIPTSQMSVRCRPPYSDPYRISADIAPHGKIATFVKRNGYSRRCIGMPADVIIKALLLRPTMETLAKMGQYRLLAHLVYRGEMATLRYWPSIKVANRHGYKVKDADLWCDYIDNLKTIGRDIRNPKFICPKNLNKAHDEVLAIVRKREDAARRRKVAQLAKEANERYKARWGVLLSMSLSIGNLTARPLQDVEEFYDEGRAMSHCVYNNGYYDKEKSIIYSVMTADGKRQATVEYDVERGEVLQCRGKANTKPARFADIMAMFNAYKNKIDKAINRC